MGTAHIFFDGAWTPVLNAYVWRGEWVQVQAVKVMGESGWVQIRFANNSTSIGAASDWADVFEMAA